jgi:hypothetical protein
MNTKFEIKPFDGSDKEIRIYAGEQMVTVDYDDVDHKDAERIARLIAAAPDLYEALEACRALIDDQFRCQTSQALEGEHVAKPARVTWHKLHAAMAKARGETS